MTKRAMAKTKLSPVRASATWAGGGGVCPGEHGVTGWRHGECSRRTRPYWEGFGKGRGLCREVELYEAFQHAGRRGAARERDRGGTARLDACRKARGSEAHAPAAGDASAGKIHRALRVVAVCKVLGDLGAGRVHPGRDAVLGQVELHLRRKHADAAAVALCGGAVREYVAHDVGERRPARVERLRER